VQVADDGRGGADPSGSGLTGLRKPRSRRSTARCASRARAGRPHPPARGAAVRVVIAEDLALLRDGLTRLLTESGFEVVAAVEDGARARPRR
jgi:hypothetical protein